MQEIEFIPTLDEYTYTFGGVAPLRKIVPNTLMKLWSEDAFNNALRTVDDRPTEKVDLRFVNPQTGPFYVVGAEPGDTLAIHIIDLSPARSWGVSAIIPFFGGLTGTDRTFTLQQALPDTTWIYELDPATDELHFHARFSEFNAIWPIQPMLGTIGVAPPGGEVRSSLVPERFGGNMDSPEVCSGNTIFLPVNVEGALFSLGDGHYRQGEGEACGTAVEGAMNSTILVDLVKGRSPIWPRVESDTHWMTIGSSRPMEDSWRIAQGEMVRWLTELFDIHALDAYQLLSQIALVPVANVVDANYSVVVKVPKALLPKANAYDGLHSELRNQGEQLLG